MSYRRRLDSRRPPGRSPCSPVSKGAGGWWRGRRSSPEVRSRRRRSSGECGVDAMVHGRRGWWALRAPGSKPSAMTRPGTSYGVCSHDGGMAGGGELSGSWGTTLQHGGEHKELGDKVSGSRRVRRCRRRGRGGSGRAESVESISGHRR